MVTKNTTLSNYMMSDGHLFYLLIILAAIVVNLIAILKYSFKDGSATCDKYILNTYLYTILAALISSILLLLLENNNVFKMIASLVMTLPGLIFMIALNIAVIILFYSIDPRNTILLHLVWTLLVTLITINLYFPFKLSKITDTLGLAIILTLTAVVSMAIIGYNYGEYVHKNIIKLDKLERILRISLLVLVIILLCFPLVSNIVKSLFNIDDGTLFLIVTGLSLLIFMLLIFTFNHNIVEKSKNCDESKLDNYPNYPKESFSLFIKIVNVFQDIVVLLNRRRLGRSIGRGIVNSVK